MTSNTPHDDDPAVEARWLDEQRSVVEDYLKHERLQHGGVAELPDWFLAPYVSIWRVVSPSHPPATGWWAISGDLPTDYRSSSEAKDARGAMGAFAERWRSLAEAMARDEPGSETSIGQREDWPELQPLLASRAQILSDWSQADALWEEDD